MFKDSKKNEGLSGAAVFSDSVIMPLKILIVLAVCIGQLQWPPGLPLPIWPLKKLPVVRLQCSPQIEEGWPKVVVEGVDVARTLICKYVHHVFWRRVGIWKRPGGHAWASLFPGKWVPGQALVFVLVFLFLSLK